MGVATIRPPAVSQLAKGSRPTPPAWMTGSGILRWHVRDVTGAVHLPVEVLRALLHQALDPRREHLSASIASVTADVRRSDSTGESPRPDRSAHA